MKKDIRVKMKALKAKLSQREVEECSNIIFHKLKDFIQLDSYDAIYTYVAFNEEIQTKSIIEYAFLKKRKVAVPKINNNKMDFYYIEKWEDLKPGYYGILEPTTNQRANDNHILMIMPGLAFDQTFNRIGYGAGFYDRYLKEREELSIDKIALAYDFQIAKKLEVEEYDVKVDHILTPTRFI